MSWFRNRHTGESRYLVPIQYEIPAFAGMTLAVILLSLSACGFQPLYATGHSQAERVLNLSDINVAPIPDREGQYLRNQLIDRLYPEGRPARASYDLLFSPLKKETVNIGIQRSATATRAQVQFSTQMRLVERGSGKVLLQRDLRTIGAYNLLDNQLATLTSQQATSENILRDMAESAVLELGLYFNRKGESP